MKQKQNSDKRLWNLGVLNIIAASFRWHYHHKFDGWISAAETGGVDISIIINLWYSYSQKETRRVRVINRSHRTLECREETNPSGYPGLKIEEEMFKDFINHSTHEFMTTKENL